MSAAYITIMLKGAIRRIHRAHPDLDWSVDSPAMREADARLTEASKAWGRGKGTLKDAQVAWRDFERALIEANAKKLF